MSFRLVIFLTFAGLASAELKNTDSTDDTNHQSLVERAIDAVASAKATADISANDVQRMMKNGMDAVKDKAINAAATAKGTMEIGVSGLKDKILANESNPLIEAANKMNQGKDAFYQHLNGQQLKLQQLKTYSFDKFVDQYNRTYNFGSEEWIKREQLFKKNLQHLIEHNSGAPKAWTAGINKFMDMSEAEFQRMLGYKGGKKMGNPFASSFLQQDWNATLKVVDLPPHHDWSPKVKKSASFSRDQGACGSCWALAAVQALEGHLEIKHGDSEMLSPQFLVSCVPNPQQCGGKGGCEGATAELAFKHVAENGIPSEVHWPYMSFTGSSGSCNQMLAKSRHASIQNHVVLPENEDVPLMQALYQEGPVVVSVDGSPWSLYEGGIFSGCDKNAIVNHAVVAVGFGEQHVTATGKTHMYWKLKNSWGKDWGEHGHIRLERFKKASDWCGIDNKPEEGTGCLGGPTEVKVCGMCGVLYDSVYPRGAKFVTPAEGGTYGKSSIPNPVAAASKMFQDAEGGFRRILRR